MDERAPHLLLVGMMGAGKSTVGRLVAERLGWEFFDSDAEVEARCGCRVADLWEQRGEAAFRLEERRVLGEGLRRARPTVVSVAGGAVLHPDTRRLLRQSGTVVWLRARPATLATRVARQAGQRPLLADDPAGTLARLAASRQPLYQQVAHQVVDVDGRTPAQVADEVAGLIGSSTAAPAGSDTAATAGSDTAAPVGSSTAAPAGADTAATRRRAR